MVACETSRRSAASSTLTRPLSASNSSRAFHRAYRSTKPPQCTFCDKCVHISARKARKQSSALRGTALVAVRRLHPPGRSAQNDARKSGVPSAYAHPRRCEGWPMTHVKAEIASQPECWGLAAKLADSPGLPARGERVAVVGCGTSWFMSMAYASLRERSGQGETDAFQASEFPHDRRYDRVLAITRSGTTTEIVDLLDALDGRAPTTVVTADGGQPAAALATDAIVLDFADERAVVQTRFATSALALLRAHLGEDLEPVCADAEVAVRLPLPVHPALAEQITFLGRGWTIGLAHEAALKCREAAAYWAEAYPAMDY